jgi:predicted RNA-binding Zn-ribbon protein involved in translation (DUF1610 family)
MLQVYDAKGSRLAGRSRLCYAIDLIVEAADCEFAMPVTEAILFECPTCGPEYKLVRVETSTVAPDSGELTCRKCGGPLRGREGRFVLKYFLVGTTW